MKSAWSRRPQARPFSRLSSHLCAIATLLVLTACQHGPSRPAVDPGPPPPVARVPASTTSSAGVPAPTPPATLPAPAAEQTLAQGVRSYQAGKYAMAEVQLRQALKDGLAGGADRANAHKYLAFIYCTSQREKLCLEAFRAARAADPAFALSKTESGHPMWARVYRQAMTENKATRKPASSRSQ